MRQIGDPARLLMVWPKPQAVQSAQNLRPAGTEGDKYPALPIVGSVFVCRSEGEPPADVLRSVESEGARISP